MTELLCASVAVQVRCVLLTSLPLIPRLASTNVTVRLVSHVSLKTGVPKAGAAGHWMVASAGQLVTVGAVLYVTVILSCHVPVLVCASVAVQVRCVLLTSLPLTPRLASTNVTVRLVSRSAEHTSELQSHHDLVCRLPLEKKLVTVGAELSITVMV